MAMNRQILWDVLMRHLHRSPHVFADGLLVPVLRTIVFHDPTQGCLVHADRCDWHDLPANISLFHSAPGCGLPIGNLTSQLFANVSTRMGGESRTPFRCVIPDPRRSLPPWGPG